MGDAPGVVRRVQAGRPQPAVRLRVGPGRVAAVHVSDFRGFIFSDTNRGVRLFGNLDGNRTQFNLAYFRQLEKDTNSQLNTFDDRDQNIVIANVYRQDFIFPGYTASGQLPLQQRRPGRPVRQERVPGPPGPGGRVPAAPGRGVLPRLGRRRAHRPVQHLARVLLGGRPRQPQPDRRPAGSRSAPSWRPWSCRYDRDWARFRVSGLYQSGDGNANNGHGDRVRRHPRPDQNFGGEFSFWRRQRIPLFGVGLTNDQSLFPNLRSSRIQGQSNFVNPGLWLVNGGRRLRHHAAAPVDQQRQLPVLRQDELAGDVHLPEQHRPVHRRGPEHRGRVAAAAEQQRRS